MKLTAPEAAWLAAMVDGEGTITVIEKRTKPHPRYRPGRQPGYAVVPMVSVANTHRPLVDRCADLFAKCGAMQSVCKASNGTNAPVWRVHAVSMSAATCILPEITPWLIAKRERAEYILAWMRTRQSMQKHRVKGRVGGGTPYGAETDSLFEQLGRNRKGR